MKKKNSKPLYMLLIYITFMVIPIFPIFFVVLTKDIRYFPKRRYHFYIGLSGFIPVITMTLFTERFFQIVFLFQNQYHSQNRYNPFSILLQVLFCRYS